MLGLLGGDYAIKAPQNFLMVETYESHPTEVADLHGKRLVAAVETGESSQNQRASCQGTDRQGQDPGPPHARGLLGIQPNPQVWLGTNHRPTISGTDLAIWRRLREIPFTVAIHRDRLSRTWTGCWPQNTAVS